MTGSEKAEEVSRLLGHLPSLFTVCVSNDCSLASYLREMYPDMITLEWGLRLPRPIYDLAINEHGLSGTLAFGGASEFVFVPWHAIVRVYTPGTRATPKAAIRWSESEAPASALPRGWSLIKGGKE